MTNLNLREPVSVWMILDRARNRTNEYNSKSGYQMIERLRDNYPGNEAEGALRAVIDAILEDSRECWRVLSESLRAELGVMQGLLTDVARVIPKLADDPKAQIIADMVMEKRYAEARAVIQELEGEHEPELSVTEMARIVERMQAAARGPVVAQNSTSSDTEEPKS